MKVRFFIVLIFIITIIQISISPLMALKNKVGQSGLTYLAISPGARLSAMADASTAAVRGIDGVFYNPAVLADIRGATGCFNQVNWLVDTKLYSMAVAYSLEHWGTVAMDLVYMDYGKFVGTKPVDTSINPRGFIFTGDFYVEDFSVGFSYAYRISDRFAFGIKSKFLYEDLSRVSIRAIVHTDTVDIVKNWTLNHWGLDFGTIYYTGFKSLAFGMSLKNFSTDMKYWYEEFQLPLFLRIGLSMDVADLFLSGKKDFAMNIALDALHSNDYLERIHCGMEIIYLNNYALRAGYQFNHDVETFSLGFGIQLNIGGLNTVLDYAYTNAQFFRDISRFSVQFTF